MIKIAEYPSPAPDWKPLVVELGGKHFVIGERDGRLVRVPVRLDDQGNVVEMFPDG